MDNGSIDPLRQRLLERREKIAQTLRCLDFQKLDIVRRQHCREASAQPSPRSILDTLDYCFHEELDDVERALERINENHYGACLGCGESMDDFWLEQFPEAEYCRSCQELKDWVAQGLKPSQSWRLSENSARHMKRDLK